MMNDDRTIFDLREDPMLREELLDTLESMLRSRSSDFRDTISYVLDNKLDLFKEFDGPFYEGEDNMLDLILPAITRLYGKYFITPPTMLKLEKTKTKKLLVRKKDKLNDWKEGIIPLMIPVVVICGLILKDNFSTSAMIFILSMAMLFIGKVPLTKLLINIS